MHIFKVLIVLTMLSNLLLADADDKWKISAGGMFVTNFETDMQLSKKGIPLGAKINTEDQLGLNSETAVFHFDSYYRFNDRHSIEGTFFGIRSNGHRKIDTDIKWEGETIEAGAQVDSHIYMNTYKINYLYSFYHNERVELGVSLGLHITALDVGLAAQGTVDGVPEESISSATSVTAPLPTAGFKIQYALIPKYLYVDYKTDYFFLKYDNFQGSLLTTSMNMEYRFVDHVGIGLGFNTSTMKLALETSDKKVEVENNLQGILLYFTYLY